MHSERRPLPAPLSPVPSDINQHLQMKLALSLSILALSLLPLSATAQEAPNARGFVFDARNRTGHRDPGDPGLGGGLFPTSGR